jgi:hypothetical protein
MHVGDYYYLNVAWNLMRITRLFIKNGFKDNITICLKIQKGKRIIAFYSHQISP